MWPQNSGKSKVVGKQGKGNTTTKVWGVPLSARDDGFGGGKRTIGGDAGKRSIRGSKEKFEGLSAEKESDSTLCGERERSKKTRRGLKEGKIEKKRGG